MTAFRNLVRFGLGGPQGNGNQQFSWIHIEDLYHIMLFLKEHKQLSGVFNCSSPNPVKLMRHLRKVMNIPIGLASPKWLLEVGAIVIRTETELITKSRWVIPERLERAGYTFRFGEMDRAFQQILKKS